MSEEDVRKIVLKAFDDADFRAQLIADMKTATEGYDLNDVEIENLQGLDEEFFDESLTLEERISRGWQMQ